MNDFWEWIARKLGREKAFSIRVWVSNWAGLVGLVVIFSAVLLLISPYAFETQKFEGHTTGKVISSSIIPGDENNPEIIVFIADIGEDQFIEARTRRKILAAKITDTLCVSVGRGQTTGRPRYTLKPMTFCE